MKNRDDDDNPSLNLWVGNLPPGSVEADLMSLFGKFGILDSVIAYATRNYAFVNFKRLDDAKKAKEALQGSVIRGSAIRIEFSRPARPGKNLWVGGISSSISKEQLESEFSKFGKIEDFKFLRDRNSALINFSKTDDAISALKSMNGKHFGGEQLRVDYLRSQPPRRDWVTHHQEPRDQPTWITPEPTKSVPRFMPPVNRRDIQSKILWIGYPPSVQIDEQMLHNAMILFGEIDQIQCFPLKNYSIVEFRSVDEARRAKEGLRGRLFNDPRIQILFSTGGDFVNSSDDGFFPVPPRLPPPDFFFHGRPIGEFPKGMTMHGGFRPVDLPPPQPEFSQRFSSPPGRAVPGTWEEINWREGKRRRMMADLAVEEAPRSMVSSGYGSNNRQSPVTMQHRPGGGSRDSASPGHIWRGMIAKGGTPVCSMRCLPLGKGIESPFPKTINCTAKTGLDTLAKHCADASEFNTVFFLPDGEEDFSAYTDFLQYLGQNNRAGVAKLADGATMFLVPPSTFLSSFLSLSSPSRLYGIVLHLSSESHQPVPTAKASDMALTPEMIATLSALIPPSSALSSSGPGSQTQSTVGLASQREMGHEKNQRYSSMSNSMLRYADQHKTEDEKDKRYQTLLNFMVKPTGQWETEDEKNRIYQSATKSTTGYAGQHRLDVEKNENYRSMMKSTVGNEGQRETVDEKNQWYRSFLKSAVGPNGQWETEDEKNHSYQSMSKSTGAHVRQPEMEDEKVQRYQTLLKLKMGSAGQRDTEDEKNQIFQWTMNSTTGYTGQQGMEDADKHSYQSMMKATMGSSSQRETGDGKNQWYQSMMKPVVAGQREMEDEKNQKHQSMLQSTIGSAGQRGTDDGKHLWYNSMLRSATGSSGQREKENDMGQRYQSMPQSTWGSSAQQMTEDGKNQWYRSMLTSTAGPTAKQELEDDKNQRHQSMMKSTAGFSGQQESESEKNQRYQSMVESKLGTASQLETDDEKNRRYQSTLQFAASLLLQVQQHQSAQGGGNQ